MRESRRRGRIRRNAGGIVDEVLKASSKALMIIKKMNFPHQETFYFYFYFY
jgi:hypothetical protein